MLLVLDRPKNQCHAKMAYMVSHQEMHLHTHEGVGNHQVSLYGSQPPQDH